MNEETKHFKKILFIGTPTAGKTNIIGSLLYHLKKVRKDGKLEIRTEDEETKKYFDDLLETMEGKRSLHELTTPTGTKKDLDLVYRPTGNLPMFEFTLLERSGEDIIAAIEGENYIEAIDDYISDSRIDTDFIIVMPALMSQEKIRELNEDIVSKFIDVISRINHHKEKSLTVLLSKWDDYEKNKGNNTALDYYKSSYNYTSSKTSAFGDCDVFSYAVVHSLYKNKITQLNPICPALLFEHLYRKHTNEALKKHKPISKPKQNINDNEIQSSNTINLPKVNNKLIFIVIGIALAILIALSSVYLYTQNETSQSINKQLDYEGKYLGKIGKYSYELELYNIRNKNDTVFFKYNLPRGGQNLQHANGFIAKKESLAVLYESLTDASKSPDTAQVIIDKISIELKDNQNNWVFKKINEIKK